MIEKTDQNSSESLSKVKITFLGTGTSQGVPVIACSCRVCKSIDPRDKRLRTSILISKNDQNISIDSGPDFRQQMLNENVQSLDAVVFTHEHKDHIAGLDDVRAFNFKSKSPMKIWATDQVQTALKREFHYAFDNKLYPGVPQLELCKIPKDFIEWNGEKLIPIEVLHYKMPVLAYRVRNFTYITDANYISDEELDKVKGTEILVINALRKEKHISHFNLEEALEMIEKINPKKAYLTHISHYLGLHNEINSILPDNVELAYDGLTIEIG